MTVFNTDTDELFVMEPLKTRVVLAEDVRRGVNQGEDENGMATAASGKQKKPRSAVRRCKNCGEPGHRKDTCPQRENNDSEE